MLLSLVLFLHSCKRFQILFILNDVLLLWEFNRKFNSHTQQIKMLLCPYQNFSLFFIEQSWVLQTSFLSYLFDNLIVYWAYFSSYFTLEVYLSPQIFKLFIHAWWKFSYIISQWDLSSNLFWLFILSIVLYIKLHFLIIWKFI